MIKTRTSRVTDLTEYVRYVLTAVPCMVPTLSCPYEFVLRYDTHSKLQGLSSGPAQNRLVHKARKGMQWVGYYSTREVQKRPKEENIDPGCNPK